MKILIAAAACHPTSGSEAYVGWQAITQLRRDHDLWVLTSGWCREGIEKFLSENPDWRNVQFFYVDKQLPDHPNRLVARIFSWIRYRRWCLLAAKMGEKLASEVKFDLAHHVTMATWRTGSPLSGIGIPWIWGPIGGGERFPWRLAGILSPVALCFEISRLLSTKVSMFSPVVRRAVRDASLVLPNNPETEDLLLRLGVKSIKMRRLAQSFMPEERLERLKRLKRITPRECGELRCVAGGNLEGRKGVAIALHALAQLKREGIPCRYTYLGRGPELEYLKVLVNQLGIAERVNFVDSLSGDEYVQALQCSHVYLLPSVRESLGITQMEAMSAGCVPVVADCGGPGPMASSAGSKPVKVSTPATMAHQIRDILMGFWENPEEWSNLSIKAGQGISEGYSAVNYRTMINRYYGMVVSTSARR